MKKDVTTPLDVELSVLPGTVTIKGKEDLTQATNLAQCRIHRWYMGPGVQRVPIREGRLRGTLFLPPGCEYTRCSSTCSFCDVIFAGEIQCKLTKISITGDGLFPGVIDLFGTVGGLIEFRAALLASRGYATFALAYFAYEDLPSEMNLDLDYFDVSKPRHLTVNLCPCKCLS